MTRSHTTAMMAVRFASLALVVTGVRTFAFVVERLLSPAGPAYIVSPITATAVQLGAAAWLWARARRIATSLVEDGEQVDDLPVGVGELTTMAVAAVGLYVVMHAVAQAASALTILSLKNPSPLFTSDPIRRQMIGELVGQTVLAGIGVCLVVGRARVGAWIRTMRAPVAPIPEDGADV